MNRGNKWLPGCFLVLSLNGQIYIAISWKEQGPHLVLSSILLDVLLTSFWATEHSWELPEFWRHRVLHSKGVTLKQCLCSSRFRFRKVFNLSKLSIFSFVQSNSGFTGSQILTDKGINKYTTHDPCKNSGVSTSEGMFPQSDGYDLLAVGKRRRGYLILPGRSACYCCVKFQLHDMKIIRIKTIWYRQLVN